MMSTFSPPAAGDLTLQTAFKAVEEVGEWDDLGGWLRVPPSARTDMQSVIKYWIAHDPTPMWRRLIWALDTTGAHKAADGIRHHAEPLTGMLCTSYYVIIHCIN